MKFSKEIKVGMLAIVSGSMLYFGFRFLKGIDFFSKTDKYYVMYQNINGLQISNPVMINGLSIGRVSDIKFNQLSGNIVVALDIDETIKLGNTTQAVLADAGLLGGKIIDLRISGANGFLEEGDTLEAFTEKGMSQLLQDKALPIMANLDSTIMTISQFVSEYRAVSGRINGMIDNLTAASAEANYLMHDNRQKISLIINDMSTILADTKTELGPALKGLSQFTDSLNQVPINKVVADLEKTIASLQVTLDAINKSQGTLGMMVNDKKLYTDLDRSVQSLDKLLVDLKANPKRYVHFSMFGSKDKSAQADTTATKK